MRIGFDYADASLPRTVFYDMLSQALRASADYVADPAAADLLFPLEDTAMETNWPRYADPKSAFLRGRFEQGPHIRYLEHLAGAPHPLCLVNMHPFFRLAQPLAACERLVLADINLLGWERTINPRTISMPALPITAGTFRPTRKQILASFRGVASHPCRTLLAQIANGASIVVQLVERQNHFGKIDARTGTADAAYVELLEKSIFGFVPRGDAEFSYRLLEVMSFGCIPVILSDGLVPPFDRTIDWSAIALHIPESRIDRIPAILAGIPATRVVAMQRGVMDAYAAHLDGLPRIVDTLLREAARILRTMAPR